jgi:quercetin dioxygenase-like cupin family protein
MNQCNSSQMHVVRAGASVQRSMSGTATQPFWIEMLLEGDGEGDLTAMRTVLDPDVVSSWHTHPAGQFLMVLSGVGRAQRDGGEIVELRAGDAVWFGPDERHWHGSAPQSSFSYVSVQGVREGRFVDWLEPVDLVIDNEA